jgi:MarR family transcriptional regulator, organic hydroperoxide resistance regulator
MTRPTDSSADQSPATDTVQVDANVTWAMRDSVSALLARTCKAHRAAAESALTQIGLHAGQELLLLSLTEAGGISQADLASALSVEPPTVCRMLQRLERCGIVRREQDAADGRISRVFMTDKGRDLQSQIAQVWTELDERTLANFTLEERVLLRRLLLQVQANLGTRERSSL